MGRKKNDGRLVWSSDDSSADALEPEPLAPKNDGTVRVARQCKGRKGKGVTVVTGVPLTGVELKTLARVLKQRCGSGGTVKNGTIEIQGDHRDTLIEELDKKGWIVKKSGG